MRFMKTYHVITITRMHIENKANSVFTLIKV